MALILEKTFSIVVHTIGREGGSTPTNLDAEDLSFCIIGTFSTMISSLRIVKQANSMFEYE